ncbi:class I SAM-dependent methyltransferase [Candidatus Cloacimonadota bacterium]
MDISKIIDFLQSEYNKDFYQILQRKKNISINELQKLIQNNPENPIKDILSQIKIQHKNKRKISNVQKYLFTEKGAQQASSTTLAHYHAEKFRRFNSIADLCCGVGMDLIQIAVGKEKVFAVDLDEETLLAAEFNSNQAGLRNIRFLQQKAEDFNISVDAIFSDPDRRPGKERKIQKEDIQPSLDALLELKKNTPNLAVKLSPAMNYKNLNIAGEHTFEFVSENGTLKEILLCLGDLATPNVRRKAIILPQNIQLVNQNIQIEIKEIEQYIFEPDPAIIRAGLVQECGAEIGYHLIDSKLAILSGVNAINSELGKCFKMKQVIPFNLKKLQQYCRENLIGELVIKTRGFPDTVEDFRKKLKLKGANKEILFIIRKGDNHLMIFAEKEES